MNFAGRLKSQRNDWSMNEEAQGNTRSTESLANGASRRGQDRRAKNQKRKSAWENRWNFNRRKEGDTQ